MWAPNAFVPGATGSTVVDPTPAYPGSEHVDSGGEIETMVGTLEWFELGGVRFEEPTVSFARTEIGAFADVYSSGNLGADFFAPVRLILDYPSSRIEFVQVRDLD